MSSAKPEKPPFFEKTKRRAPARRDRAVVVPAPGSVPHEPVELVGRLDAEPPPAALLERVAVRVGDAVAGAEFQVDARPGPVPEEPLVDVQILAGLGPEATAGPERDDLRCRADADRREHGGGAQDHDSYDRKDETEPAPSIWAYRRHQPSSAAAPLDQLHAISNLISARCPPGPAAYTQCSESEESEV